MKKFNKRKALELIKTKFSSRIKLGLFLGSILGLALLAGLSISWIGIKSFQTAQSSISNSQIPVVMTSIQHELKNVLAGKTSNCLTQLSELGSPILWSQSKPSERFEQIKLACLNSGTKCPEGNCTSSSQTSIKKGEITL